MFARREVLWSGNRESIRRTLFSRESILWWILCEYTPKRREYLRMINNREWPHMPWVVLRSRAEIREMLDAVDAGVFPARLREGTRSLLPNPWDDASHQLQSDEGLTAVAMIGADRDRR